MTGNRNVNAVAVAMAPAHKDTSARTHKVSSALAEDTTITVDQQNLQQQQEEKQRWQSRALYALCETKPEPEPVSVPLSLPLPRPLPVEENAEEWHRSTPRNQAPLPLTHSQALSVALTHGLPSTTPTCTGNPPPLPLSIPAQSQSPSTSPSIPTATTATTTKRPAADCCESDSRVGVTGVTTHSAESSRVGVTAHSAVVWHSKHTLGVSGKKGISSVLIQYSLSTSSVLAQYYLTVNLVLAQYYLSSSNNTNS